MNKLVPGRECGDCTLCCIIPGIDKPEMQKQPASACRFCAKGCTIYDTRPEVCRDYYCGWRKLDTIPDDWRPDKSGVYVELHPDVPAHFNAPFGLILMLVANPLRTLRQPWFIDFVARGVGSNVPLFLSLPGPKGKMCAELPLNTRQIYEASRKSRSDTRLALEKILSRLQAHQFVPQILEHSGHDVST